MSAFGITLHRTSFQSSNSVSRNFKQEIFCESESDLNARQNLFQWINLGLLPFLVPAGFVGIPQTSRCRWLLEKIVVSSRAPKKLVDPRALGPLPR
jgi:hypothetical protein